MKKNIYQIAHVLKVHSIKTFLLATLLLTGFTVSLQAQEVTYRPPSWWFGGAAAANFNFYNGTTQRLNATTIAPTPFHKGSGTGLFVAPLMEFHRPNSQWGFMLQAGFDSRNGKFRQVINPCNCPADLSTNIAYLTVEPSLRFSPIRSDVNFHLFLGPRVAFNVLKTFDYKIGANPEFPANPVTYKYSGDLSHVNKALVSMQVGAAYDFQATSPNQRNQVLLTPFISLHPYFGQDPRSNESWNVTTVRVGLAIKAGRSKKTSTGANVDPQTNDKTTFYVNAPKNTPVEYRIRETFPVRNYIYFDLGSTSIPDRYELLNKNQVRDFKEDQLDLYQPKNLSGRSRRQMTVYYNVLNILGDRMGKLPNTTIALVGSSEKGAEDGRLMAQSVKNYLVTIFGISESRIKIEGRDKPKIAAEQPGGTLDLDLLREGDQRVSIETSSTELLMEFQSGPDAPLRPIEIINLDEMDSNITIHVEGAKEAYRSWSLEVKDEKGKMGYFGPYTDDHVSLPVSAVLGTRPEGHYKVTQVGITRDGKTVRKETTMHLVAWTAPKIQDGMRYSVLFEFDQSKAPTIYSKYLTDIVTPKIPKGGKVIIHGHTDIIGDDAHNKQLSYDRANEVKTIIEAALAKAGRTDVTFEVFGYGEDQNLSPFDNKTPEERSYNRTVVIDIMQ
jgi:outer membrane protein OmpA-like peptidoglycan-associated protein